ncbi:MAG: hypothetical protein IPG72_15235 [Ardenticatenales bacterium]|jgi:hypothetical protein|nr:hypothetical protein [Ardenticatenales bacterium]
MPNRIDSAEYWIEDFEPSGDDLEALYAHMLDVLQPATMVALAATVVRRRVSAALAAQAVNTKGDGAVYMPVNRFEVGQKLVFPAVGGANGKVEAVRPGNNPGQYGAYDVIAVTLDGRRREFAAGIGFPHELAQAIGDLDADALADKWSRVIEPRLRERIGGDGEWSNLGDRWILKSLLPEVNTGHRNLAEAILMLAGEPLPAKKILKDLDVDKSAPEATRELGLDLALSTDKRFRNVGAIEAPLWTLATLG